MMIIDDSDSDSDDDHYHDDDDLLSAPPQLDRAREQYNRSASGARPQHKTGLLGLYGPQVDSIEFYEEKLAHVNDRIKEMKVTNDIQTY
jgi:hypothetical protein